MRSIRLVGIGCLLLAATLTSARDFTSPDPRRGEKALKERAFTPLAWTFRAYETAWKSWPGAGVSAPANYAEAFRAHYGLHEAPFPNHGYPMGLREVRGLLTKGLTTDCLLCHGGSIFGQSYIGLGNASLDIQAFFEDLYAADGIKSRLPHTFSRVRGTSEAGAMAVLLHGMREPNLERKPFVDLGLRDDLCEDTPAWWLLKKKRTMYYTGGADARSVRSIMQFMLTPLNAPAVFDREETTFADIRAYILSLEPPRFPFPIDQKLAERGGAVFNSTCARCHGTYGPGGSYPNKVIPIDEIGTDRNRYDGISRAFGVHYNRGWFAKENEGWILDDYPARETAGYQAPPLDGIWATAPYFHNGSAPTVYHVLNSQARSKLFTRSYRTGKEDYDPSLLGWRFEQLGPQTQSTGSAFDRRKVYDTSQPGRHNDGHTYGDDLTDAERWAVIEYLKTL